MSSLSMDLNVGLFLTKVFYDSEDMGYSAQVILINCFSLRIQPRLL